MADRFFDTSAVVKHYRPEVGTAKIDAFLAEAVVVEFHSALARLVREGHITAAVFHQARGRFLADIASGLWTVTPASAGHFQQAEHLLVNHALARRLRTLDAMQLAAALDLNASIPLAAFVCADAGLCLVAGAEGLTPVNPEVP